MIPNILAALKKRLKLSRKIPFSPKFLTKFSNELLK